METGAWPMPLRDLISGNLPQSPRSPAERRGNLFLMAIIAVPLVFISASRLGWLVSTGRPAGNLVVITILLTLAALAATERSTQQRRAGIAEQRATRLEQTVFAGIVWIENGRLITANPQAASMFGFAPGDLRGRTLASLLSPHERGRLRSLVSRARRTPVEVEALRVDGSTFRAEIRAGSSGDAPYPEPIAILDISARWSLQIHLQQAKKTEVVARLAGGLAHDFGDQLTAILGRSELLLRSDHPQRREDLEQIHQAAQRATALTRQLRTFSSRRRPAARWDDLDEIVRATVRELLPRLLPETIRVSLLLAVGRKPVFADRGQLEQLILHLALSELEAASESGRLVLATRLLPARAEAAPPGLSTADPGPGRWACLEISTQANSAQRDDRAPSWQPAPPEGDDCDHVLGIARSIVEQNGGDLAIDADAMTRRWRIRFCCAVASAA